MFPAGNTTFPFADAVVDTHEAHDVVAAILPRIPGELGTQGAFDAREVEHLRDAKLGTTHRVAKVWSLRDHPLDGLFLRGRTIPEVVEGLVFVFVGCVLCMSFFLFEGWSSSMVLIIVLFFDSFFVSSNVHRGNTQGVLNLF